MNKKSNMNKKTKLITLVVVVIIIILGSFFYFNRSTVEDKKADILSGINSSSTLAQVIESCSNEFSSEDDIANCISDKSPDLTDAAPIINELSPEAQLENLRAEVRALGGDPNNR